MDTILRKEAWKIIDSGELFNLIFITADRRRGTGGKRIELKNALKVTGADVPDTIPLNQQEQLQKAVKQDLAKDPNHGLHKTKNVYVPTQKQLHIHKIHYRLITWVNNKRVIQ